MTDYESMYYFLFNKITDITNELKGIQLQAEEMYIKQCKIIELNIDKKDNQPK